MHVIYLSNCCFAKEDELYAAAWLGCCCLRHPEGNVRVDDRLYAQLYSFSTSVRCSAASSTGVPGSCDNSDEVVRNENVQKLDISWAFDGVFEWVDCLMTIRASCSRPLAFLGKFFPCSDLFFKLFSGLKVKVNPRFSEHSTPKHPPCQKGRQKLCLKRLL
jgi:hypothetical protein